MDAEDRLDRGLHPGKGPASLAGGTPTVGLLGRCARPCLSATKSCFGLAPSSVTQGCALCPVQPLILKCLLRFKEETVNSKAAAVQTSPTVADSREHSRATRHLGRLFQRTVPTRQAWVSPPTSHCGGFAHVLPKSVRLDLNSGRKKAGSQMVQ